MPVLKHAKKKLKQDKKRTVRNKTLKDLYKDLVKKARLNPTPEAISSAFKQVDKAAKNFIIHKNKASRLKASLAKLKEGTGPVKEANPKTKKATKAKIIANKASTKAKSTKKKKS